MKIYSRIWSLVLPGLLFLTNPTLAQQRKRAAGSAASYARARQVLEAGLTALGGLQAIRALDDVKV